MQQCIYLHLHINNCEQLRNKAYKPVLFKHYDGVKASTAR